MSLKETEDNLEWTGERYVPGVEGDVAIEHLHRYAIARELAHGKDVLDIACGEGYGTCLLSEVAKSAIGVDSSEDVVRHASRRYVRRGLRFLSGLCERIPVDDSSIDLVVSFETLEHHAKHAEMLSEFKRVLRPEGLLIISSPDKHEYTDIPGTTNAFHVRELYANEFDALLRTRFKKVSMYGQRIHYGSVIASVEKGSPASWCTFTGSASNIRKVEGVERSIYLIAVASDVSSPSLPVGIFSEPKAIWERDQQIESLRRLLTSANDATQVANEGRIQLELLAHKLTSERDLAQSSAEDLQKKIESTLAVAREWESQYASISAGALEWEKKCAATEMHSTRLSNELDEARNRVSEAAILYDRLQSSFKASVESLEASTSEIERRQYEDAKNQEILRSQVEMIRDLRETLVSLQQRLADKESQLIRFDHDREEFQRAIRGLVRSSSWRITAPLRTAKQVSVSCAQYSGRVIARRERSIVGVWRSMPIPESLRNRLKSFCFSHFGSLLGFTRSYDAWTEQACGEVAELSSISIESNNGVEAVPDLASLNASIPTSIAFEEVSDPLVSVIVPVYNKLEFTLACLSSLHLNLPDCSIEVVLLDDASTDETQDVVSQIPGIRYLRNESNLGFLRSANRGASIARGKYLYFLNNDAEVRSGAIDSLLSAFRDRPSVGIVGSKLVYPSGPLQEAGAVLNTDGSAELVGLNRSPETPSFNFLREVDYCSGASMMIDRDLFVSLGGFDDAYAPAYFEDADLALRVRAAGHRIIYQPASHVVHHLSVTTNDYGPGKLAMIENNKARFLERWQTTLDEMNRVRLIAFYLPQYHPIPENDSWWGEGFTEWFNVKKAQPSFKGHHQPHVPLTLGYYDLRLPDVREEQAALARAHGIYGFCYYYYWFSGRRLLQKPLADVLQTGQPNFPFCVCWANESWSRRWDGRDDEVLMEQTYSPADDIAFIESLFPLFSDDRYIRINGRPVLLVYRAEKLPNAKCTVDRWRRACFSVGIPDPFIVRVCSFLGLSDHHPPTDFGFDAAVEFPPHGLAVRADTPEGTFNDFSGVFFDYVATANRFRAHPMPPYRLFKSVMPAWDNTARRQNAAHIFLNSDPLVYENWLSDVIRLTRQFSVGEERLVFINAWNEWAEGNHLEPDVRYGKGYLQATRRAWETACGLRVGESADKIKGRAATTPY